MDKHFLSASKLALAINLEPDQFDFCQPTGPNSEWHLITSLTTFYQEASAAEQSQKAWGQSKIIQQFKEGKIRRACYGYQEVETGFEIYLGACEDSKYPWPDPIPRKNHMGKLALRESISFSLDVTDFRDFLGISTQTISDDRILQIMHAARACSKHLPEKIKLESKVWLAQYDLQEDHQ